MCTLWQANRFAGDKKEYELFFYRDVGYAGKRFCVQRELDRVSLCGGGKRVAAHSVCFVVYNHPALVLDKAKVNYALNDDWLF